MTCVPVSFTLQSFRHLVLFCNMPPKSQKNAAPTVDIANLKGDAQVMAAVTTALGEMKNTKTALGAIPTIRGLCERPEKWLEPYLIEALRHFLPSFAASKGVQKTIEDTGKAIINVSKPSSVRMLLTRLHEGMNNGKWQVKEGSMKLLEHLAKKHSQEVGKCLPETVMHLIECLQDTKPEVRNCAMQVCYREATALRLPLLKLTKLSNILPAVAAICRNKEGLSYAMNEIVLLLYYSTLL